MTREILLTNEEIICILDSLLIADKLSTAIGFLLTDDNDDNSLNRSIDFNLLYHRLYNEVYKCTD